MKKTLKKAFFNIASYTGLNEFYSQNIFKTSSTIIAYHNVLSSPFKENLYPFFVDTGKSNFIKQLDFLSKNFEIGDPEEILEDNCKGNVYLSFDDGMLNNYTEVLPILERMKLKAIFGIITDLVDGKITHVWRDMLFLTLFQRINDHIIFPMSFPFSKTFITEENLNKIAEKISLFIKSNMFVRDPYKMLEELAEINNVTLEENEYYKDRFSPMNWDMIREIEKAGHKIAAHTKSHLPLRYLNENKQKDEIEGSRIKLQSELKKEVEIFIYPYGNWSEVSSKSVDIVSKSSFELALMNTPPQKIKSKCTFTQPRISLPNTENTAYLKASLSGLRFFFK